MRRVSVFKTGFLSMMAAIGWFIASNAFASDSHITNGGQDGMAESVSEETKSPETATPQWTIVDSEGNHYLHIPTPDGKVVIQTYTKPMSH